MPGRENERHMETDNWLQALTAFQQENIVLKNRLAEAIRKCADGNILERLEYFQNNFLNKDMIISILRYDIAAFRKMQENPEYGQVPELQKKLSDSRNKLRRDIVKMNNEFTRLRTEFNVYLHEFCKV